MFLYSQEKIREIFRQLQLHFPKAPILNLTDVPTGQDCTWIKLYFKFLRTRRLPRWLRLLVERECTSIWIRAVTQQSDKDLQQCAEFHFLLTGSKGGGRA
jgi:hypothetical protein